MYRFLIPFVTYLANASFFYQQTWHYYTGAWLLAIAAVCCLRAKSVPLRLALAVLFLPCAWVALRPETRPHASPLTMTTTPNGERLWLSPTILARTENLIAALAFSDAHKSLPSAGKGFIILERRPITVVSHMHFFYLVPQAIRHTMIFPGWLRPWDFPVIEATVPHLKAVVLPSKNRSKVLPPRTSASGILINFPGPFATTCQACFLTQFRSTGHLGFFR